MQSVNLSPAPISIDEREKRLLEAFPPARPGIKPAGSRVLLQIRSPKTKTASGLILVEETQEIEKWNTQVAKVIAVGPLAFKNRNTQAPWPEGEWCQPGNYVRCPKYGGDRWEVPVPGSDQPALFVVVNDLDIIGVVEDDIDPLTIRAFL